MSVSMISEDSGKGVSKLSWIMPYLTQPHSEELLATVHHSGAAPHPTKPFLTWVNLSNHSVLKSAQCCPHFSQSTYIMLGDTP